MPTVWLWDSRPWRIHPCDPFGDLRFWRSIPVAVAGAYRQDRDRENSAIMSMQIEHRGRMLHRSAVVPVGPRFDRERASSLVIQPHPQASHPPTANSFVLGDEEAHMPVSV